MTKMRKKLIIIASLAVVTAVTLCIVTAQIVGKTAKGDQENQQSESVTEAPTEGAPTSYMMADVEDKVIVQDKLMAGCETYACTMLMHILGFDLSEFDFANNYLDCHYVFEDEETGAKEGPDMYSAFAGTAYAGWGVYAPSMAKSMNKYLADEKSEFKAYNYENIPLDTLCEEYVVHDIPVMVWATTDMQEPYVFDTWTVNYVDENAKTKIGDTFSWYAHEHCLVLVGYNEKEYFFCDSAAGKVSHFDKKLVAKRYEQMGSQCIVVK